MPRPVSRHRAREGADRWSGDIRSFPGCAGLSGKNVLARLTGPGLAANDLARTCSAYPRLRLSRSKAWMAGTRLTAVRFGFLLQLHKGAEGPGTTFGSPWPDLVRPPTSLNVALSTAGKDRDREQPRGSPLPHHRAYGSRTRRFIGLCGPDHEGRQAEGGEESVGHRYRRCEPPGRGPHRDGAAPCTACGHASTASRRWRAAVA